MIGKHADYGRHYVDRKVNIDSIQNVGQTLRRISDSNNVTFRLQYGYYFTYPSNTAVIFRIILQMVCSLVSVRQIS